MELLATKLNSMCVSFENTIWEVDKYVEELINKENEARVRWNDEVSRFFFTRFVLHFMDDSEKLKEHEKAVLDHASSFVTDTNQLCEYTFKIDKLSLEIARYLKRATREIDASQKDYEIALEYNGKVKDLVGLIERAFRQEEKASKTMQDIFSRRRDVY